jgi:hypothetical protein
MRFSPLVGRVLLAFLLLMSFLGILISSQHLKLIESEMAEEETVFYLPRPEMIRPLLLGNEGFLADLVWIRTVGYFGDEFLGRKRFRYLEGLLDFATDLDPRFERVYIWAGAILMYRGGAITKEKILASVRILEKGWQRIQNDAVGWRHTPDYWMIPQMIGFNYAVELRDKKRGAPYIAATGRIPGSPSIYRTWAATLYKKSGDLEEGTRLLEDMLAVETLQAQLRLVEGEGIQEEIRNRLNYYYTRLYGEKGAKERLKILEARIAQLLTAWKEQMPFIPFDLFLVLRNDPENAEEEAVADTWKASFPRLAANLL